MGETEDRKTLIRAALDLLPPIFADCLTSRVRNMALDGPWIDGGVVYASNGVIMVRRREPTPEIVEAVEKLLHEEKGYPGIPSRRFQYEWDRLFVLPGDQELAALEKCGLCEGGGAFQGAVCEGCGELVQAPGASIPCPACRATGIENAEGREVEGASLSVYYAWLLRRHGVSQVWCPVPPAEKRPFRFEIDGHCDGVVMPTVRMEVRRESV